MIVEREESLYFLDAIRPPIQYAKRVYMQVVVISTFLLVQLSTLQLSLYIRNNNLAYSFPSF